MKTYGKRKRMSKRSTRPYKRRRFNITRRQVPYQTKFIRITRWSNKDTSNNVHLTILGTAGGNNPGSTVFALSDVPNNSEIISMFDNYTIRKVFYRWVLFRDPSAYQTTAGTQGIFPRITWAHDFNDSVPVSRNLLMQYPKMKEFFFSETRQKTPWYSIKPASLSLMFENSTNTAYKPTWGTFVDTNDNMVHYGIKYFYNSLHEGNTLVMECKYVLDCKGIS